MAKEEKIKILTTERPEGPEHESTLRTPSGELNVEIVTQSWWAQALIRFGRTYLQGLVGFLVAGGAASVAGVNIGVGDFWNAAGLAFAPAVISLIHNAIELLTKLDVTNPELRA